MSQASRSIQGFDACDHQPSRFTSKVRRLVSERRAASASEADGSRVARVISEHPG